MHSFGPYAAEKSLHALFRLIASEGNPNNLISHVASDARLLKEARDLYRKKASGIIKRESLLGLCQIHKVPPDYFEERLRLIAYVLHLVEHEQDHYTLLGVEHKASQEEIKHAFRHLSLASHPDANPDDPAAGERFRSIYRAYEVLHDPVLRRHYDLHLADPGWMEDDPREEMAAAAKRRGRRRLACELTVLVILLVILSLLVDYQLLLTNRYHRTAEKSPPASEAIEPTGSNTRASDGLTGEGESTSLQQSPGRRVESISSLPTSESAGRFSMQRYQSGWDGAGNSAGSAGKSGPISSDDLSLPHDVDKKIADFLTRYVRAYESRNVAELLKLFEPDAMVNGEPLTSLSRMYRESSRRSDWIRCRIELSKWDVSRQQVDVSGRLHLNVQLSGFSPVESSGPIKFLLVRRGADLLAKRLDYDFK